MIATEITSVNKKIDGIIEKSIKPYIENWEKSRFVPFDILKILGDEGIIYDCSIPEKSLVNKLYLAKALGETSLGISSTILNSLNIPLFLINHYANSVQREKYLKPYLKGEIIGAIAISEIQGGSNFIDENTTSIQVTEEHYVLNGSKHFILNLPGADFVIVLCKSLENNTLAQTLVIVPTNEKGVTIERIDTSGLQTAAFGKVTFNNVCVTKEQVIGRLHKGLIYLDEALTEERLVGTYALMSMTRDVLKDTYEYVNERPMYNGKLSQLQVIRHKLADLSGEFEVANAFIEDVIENWDNISKKERSTKVAMVKLVCSEASINVVNGCMQLFGGNGFLNDTKISRQFRDILGATSFAGTLEMMKEIISNRKL
jgi:acyl-CoA dehydrogenase